MTRNIECAFQEIDLPVPEIPGRWASRLRERDSWLFCTGEPPKYPLNDFEAFADRGISGSLENGLTIGWQGYGVNNWALHYYLVEEDLLVLLQRRWGNIYDDLDHCRNDLLQTFADLSELLSEFHRVWNMDAALPGRLTVLDGVREEPRWSFTPRTTHSIHATGTHHLPTFLLDWNTSENVLSAARAELKKGW